MTSRGCCCCRQGCTRGQTNFFHQPPPPPRQLLLRFTYTPLFSANAAAAAVRRKSREQVKVTNLHSYDYHIESRGISYNQAIQDLQRRRLSSCTPRQMRFPFVLIFIFRPQSLLYMYLNLRKWQCSCADLHVCMCACSLHSHHVRIFQFARPIVRLFSTL